MNVGYIRASTDKQDLKQQRGIIERYIIDKKMILDDEINISISSRKTLEERKINELFSKLKKGDNLIVSEISRIARSIKELEIIFEAFKKMEVDIILIKEGLTVEHTEDNPLTKMFLQVLGMFAEFERNNISYRTKQALKSKTDEGMILGHNKTFLKSKYDNFEDEIYDLKENHKMSFEKICSLLDRNEKLGFKQQSLRNWFCKRYDFDKNFKVWQKNKKWEDFKNGVKNG